MIRKLFCFHFWSEMLTPPFWAIKTMGYGDKAWECCKCHKVIVKPYNWRPIQ